MKSRKKYFIIGAAILLFALLAGVTFIAACGPPGFCDMGPHRMFCGEGSHPRFSGKDFSEFILARIDSRVEDLDLSETQREEYRGIRQRVKGKFVFAMEKRREFFKELRDEINADNPDMNALAGRIKLHLGKMEDFMSGNLDLLMEFYNILDEDQKARVIEKMRDKMSWLGSTMPRD
ncbi:MAG: hypothetical protein U9R52_02810 [Candidatus Omnitrophota bacterium]|nr:hypothetical protein [Candidatus Omnitrophota bacterium]